MCLNFNVADQLPVFFEKIKKKIKLHELLNHAYSVFFLISEDQFLIK
jgi:hypothetical protein